MNLSENISLQPSVIRIIDDLKPKFPYYLFKSCFGKIFTYYLDNMSVIESNMEKFSLLENTVSVRFSIYRKTLEPNCVDKFYKIPLSPSLDINDETVYDSTECYFDVRYDIIEFYRNKEEFLKEKLKLGMVY